MRFKVVGANSETGDDVDVMLEAASQPEVEKLASAKGILVSTITAVAPPLPAHAPPAAHGANASHAPVAAHANASQAPAAARGANASQAPAAGRMGQASGTHAGVAAPAGPPAHKAVEKDFSTISLVEDDAPAGDASDPSAARAERTHGMITVNANSPSETAHTGAGTIQQAKHAEATMEYHIILNQSLFLLESAVNKHLVDGWEPQGGLAVGVSNNALQFFQSMVRRKRLAAAAAPAAGAAPATAAAPAAGAAPAAPAAGA